MKGILSVVLIVMICFLSSCNPASVNLAGLELQTMKGKNTSLDKYKNKTVLLNFWATWCGPCIKEMPSMQEAYKRLKKDYHFVLVSDEPIEKIKEFVDANDYTFDFLHTTHSVKDLGIYSIPQTYLVKDGIVINSYSGSKTWAAETMIAELTAFAQKK